jgi:hypothetical protein
VHIEDIISVAVQFAAANAHLVIDAFCIQQWVWVSGRASLTVEPHTPRARLSGVFKPTWSQHAPRALTGMVHSCATISQKSIHTPQNFRHHLLAGHFAVAVMQPLQKAGDLPARSCVSPHSYPAIHLLQTPSARVVHSCADTTGSASTCTYLLRHIQTGKRCTPAAAII